MMSFLFFEIVVLKTIFWKLAFESNFFEVLFKVKNRIDNFSVLSQRFLHEEESFIMHYTQISAWRGRFYAVYSGYYNLFPTPEF